MKTAALVALDQDQVSLVEICKVPVTWSFAEACEKLGVEKLEVLDQTETLAFSIQPDEKKLSVLPYDNISIVCRRFVEKSFRGRNILIPDIMGYKKGIVDYLVGIGDIHLIEFKSKRYGAWSEWDWSELKGSERTLKEIYVKEQMEELAEHIDFSKSVIDLPTTFLNIWTDKPEIVYTKQYKGRIFYNEVDDNGQIKKWVKYGIFEDNEMIYRRFENGKFYGSGEYFLPRNLFLHQGDVYAMVRNLNVTLKDLNFIDWMQFNQVGGHERSPIKKEPTKKKKTDLNIRY